MKTLAAQRYAEYKAFLRQKDKKTGQRKTEKQFTTRILIRYNMKGWAKHGWNKTKKKDVENAVYAMLKTVEKPYKKKNKKYRSPNVKKRRDYQGTKSKIAKSVRADMPRWIAELKKKLSRASTDQERISLQGQINALYRRYGNI